MKKVGNLLWGLVLIFIGVIFALNALNIAKINIFFDGWWTLFIIIPCFIGLFTDNEKTGSIIGIIIGVCLLLACQDVLSFSLLWKLIVPFVLVAIGLSIIFKDVIGNKVRKEIKKMNKPDKKEYCSTFSGQTLSFAKENFTGCNISAIFGSVKCDLTDAVIKEDVVIDATSVFGGITVVAPAEYAVKIASTAIFGGVSDDRKNKKADGKPTIYINATCIFGGVEIK